MGWATGISSGRPGGLGPKPHASACVQRLCPWITAHAHGGRIAARVAVCAGSGVVFAAYGGSDRSDVASESAREYFLVRAHVRTCARAGRRADPRRRKELMLDGGFRPTTSVGKAGRLGPDPRAAAAGMFAAASRGLPAGETGPRTRARLGGSVTASAAAVSG